MTTYSGCTSDGRHARRRKVVVLVTEVPVEPDLYLDRPMRLSDASEVDIVVRPKSAFEDPSVVAWVLDLDALTCVVRERRLHELQSRKWYTVMPYSASEDVLAAAGAVREGRLGTLLSGTVTVGVGASIRREWDDDVPNLASPLAGALAGLHAFETVSGDLVSSVLCARSGLRGTQLLGSLTSGAVVYLEVVGRRVLPTPGFSLTLTGEAGRLMIRPPFAIDDLALRTADGHGWTFPDLRGHLPMASHPHSQPRGLELMSAVAALISSPHVEAADVSSVMRLMSLLDPHVAREKGVDR